MIIVFLQLLIATLLLLLLVAEIIFLIKLVIFATKGAPYKTTDDTTIEHLIASARLKKGDKIVDLGSGDGKIIIAFAKKGYEAHGVEINPILTWLTRRRIKQLGIENKAFVHRRDMWEEDISLYDVIIIYQITYIMGRMEKKLRKEMKPGARVLSNHFIFPHWKPLRKLGRVSVYTEKGGK